MSVDGVKATDPTNGGPSRHQSFTGVQRYKLDLFRGAFFISDDGLEMSEEEREREEEECFAKQLLFSEHSFLTILLDWFTNVVRRHITQSTQGLGSKIND